MTLPPHTAFYHFPQPCARFYDKSAKALFWKSCDLRAYEQVRVYVHRSLAQLLQGIVTPHRCAEVTLHLRNQDELVRECFSKFLYDSSRCCAAPLKVHGGCLSRACLQPCPPSPSVSNVSLYFAGICTYRSLRAGLCSTSRGSASRLQIWCTRALDAHNVILAGLLTLRIALSGQQFIGFFACAGDKAQGCSKGQGCGDKGWCGSVVDISGVGIPLLIKCSPGLIQGCLCAFYETVYVRAFAPYGIFTRGAGLTCQSPLVGFRSEPDAHSTLIDVTGA
jgi:hypothetical protein